MVFTTDNKSLKEQVTITWVLSGALAVLICGVVFVIMGWLDYRNIQERIVDDLLAKSTTASRRMSAELLLGSSGAASSVSKGPRTELGLETLEIVRGNPCIQNATLKDDYCHIKTSDSIFVMRAIPHLQEPMYVAVSNPNPSFFTFSRFSSFFFNVFPIGLVLAFALGLQRYFIRKYVLAPLGSLVDTSTGSQLPQKHWPKEIKDIAHKLSTSFEEKEQAVFGQMARGVIHDIRTLLHSVLSATQLVQEQDANSDKRQARLEMLFKASEINLPKINDLVTLTLDGSRDITVRRKPEDIITTIQSVIKTNESLGIAKNISIQISTAPERLVVAHDPIQLERVITNLIKNGIEACLKKTSNTRDPKVVVFAEIDSKRNEVAISVDDSGVGLPAQPEKVFRLLKSTKVHGSGLGLIVARKIVQAHGGDLIPKHSDILGGARFEIRLPMEGSV